MKTVLNVALPKGRLGEKVYAMFEKAGFPCPSIHDGSRKLIFENEQAGVRYFWVKPSDVAIYVERGAADIGVAGKEILLEYEDTTVRMPMNAQIRSLNLSNSVAILVYEALRHRGFEGMQTEGELHRLQWKHC